MKKQDSFIDLEKLFAQVGEHNRTGRISPAGDPSAMSEKRQAVLMSRDNPEGHKLEELAVKLQQEMQAKTDLIRYDDRWQAQTVVSNNQQIIELLKVIENIQRASFRALATLGPDEGPLGQPRVG